MSSDPRDPIAAATHRDPYPYYARLVRERPLYHDPHLQLWVASSAAVVAQVLASELCHVRPAAEPVPRTLGTSAASSIFGRLVRMIDGAEQRRCKRAITAVLGRLERNAIRAAVQACADVLSPELQRERSAAALTRFMLALPIRALAVLLGVPREQVAAVADRAAAFAISITPTASAAEIELGAAAAEQLLELLGALLHAQRMDPGAALLGSLARELTHTGATSDEAILANGIGFMSQSYEATAGLIGNTLLALARTPSHIAAVRATPQLLEALVQRVLYLDPPSQSTRRFVVRAGSVAGQAMQSGDVILVMLAAAGRDSPPQPLELSLQEVCPSPGTFGAGVHACPGAALAALIAATAVEQLLALGLDLSALLANHSYRPSNHVRVPVFA